MRLTEDAWLAEDLVQEVFIKVWLKRKNLPELEQFRSWLITVTTNAIYDMLRKRNLEKDYLDGLVRELNLVNHPVSEEESTYEDLIRQASATLSPKQYQVFNLIKKEGYTREETAELMRVSPETVKSHLEMAMRHIRAYCITRMDSGTAFVIFSIILKKYF
jgi:RNA polymerase sigma-70 factor (ECF subfamily)